MLRDKLRSRLEGSNEHLACCPSKRGDYPARTKTRPTAAPQDEVRLWKWNCSRPAQVSGPEYFSSSAHASVPYFAFHLA
jgi:hypothetical protein